MAARGDTAAYLKRFLFLYAFGVVLALQLTSIMEFIGSFSIPWVVRTFAVSVGFPCLFVFMGRRFFPVGKPSLGIKVWGLNTLALFGFWAGGYFVVGSLSYHGDFHSMGIALDEAIPFAPDWVFIYLTVYAFFLMPLFYIDDMKELIVLDGAQIITLSISYTTFIVFPVAFDRPPVAPSDFSTWTLSLVHAQDPAWNCFPSTHCATCTVAALGLIRANKKFAWWAIPSTLAICVSTVMTKQHFVLDALVGVLLGCGTFLIVNHVVRHTNLGKSLTERLQWLGRTLTGEV